MEINDLVQLIQWTYGNLTSKAESNDLEFFAHRCIVAPTNDAANEVNELILKTHFGDCEEFLSCDSIQGDDASGEHYPVVW